MNSQTAKITPGRWVFNQFVEHAGTISADTVGKRIAVICAPSLGQTSETDANGRLIAEAGTVANETGLTPRQLADQRAELLGLLQELIDIEGPQPGTAEWADKARAAIQRATEEQP